MRKKIILYVFIIAVFALGMIIGFNLGAPNKRKNPVSGSSPLDGVRTGNGGFKPNQGYVPDEETAVKIAEAVWYNIYGDVIYDSLPFWASYDE